MKGDLQACTHKNQELADRMKEIVKGKE